LFQGLSGDGFPTPLSFGQAPGIWPRHASFGHKGYESKGTQFGQLSHNTIHLPGPQQGLPYRELEMRFRNGGMLGEDQERDRLERSVYDPGLVFRTFVVKEEDLVTKPQPQNSSDVPHIRPSQDRPV